MKEKIISERKLQQKTILSFALFFLLFGAAIFFWYWLKSQPNAAAPLGGIPAPLRKGLNANDHLFSAAFSPNKLLKEYPKSEAATHVRVNGNIGMRSALDAANYRVSVVKATGDTLFITMDDIKKLPKVEVVYDFKCIEGWSQKTWWGGARFSDFIKAYHLNTEAARNYVGMVTPDGQYYVGIDMPSALHPQTLLCYEMNGKPLPENQGYPLRLIIPVKYGIKHIKRIGTMFFSQDRPRDYWAERGYDYYSGH